VPSKKPRQRKQQKPSIDAPEPIMLELASLNEATYNPRFISDEEMRSLKASLRKHGLVESLVVQKKGTVLIAGHQRLRALREIAEAGEVSVPERVACIVLDVNDSTAKQLNITLNRVGGEFDPFKLGQVLADIHHRNDFDEVAIGFNGEEIAELVKAATTSPEDLANELESSVGDLGVFAKSVTLTVPFPSVKERDEAKVLLEELAGKGKHGEYILKLLHQARAMARVGKAKVGKRSNGKRARA